MKSLQNNTKETTDLNILELMQNINWFMFRDQKTITNGNE